MRTGLVVGVIFLLFLLFLGIGALWGSTLPALTWILTVLALIFVVINIQVAPTIAPTPGCSSGCEDTNDQIPFVRFVIQVVGFLEPGGGDENIEDFGSGPGRIGDHD